MINPIDGSMMVFAEKPQASPQRRGSSVSVGDLGNSPPEKNLSKEKLSSATGEGQKSPGKEKLTGISREYTAVSMWGQLFKYYSHLPEKSQRSQYFIIFPPPSVPPNNEVCAELHAVDMGRSAGVKTTKIFPHNGIEGGKKEIHVNLGKSFNFDMFFYRPLDLKCDQVDLMLEKEDGTLPKIPIKVDGLNQRKVSSTNSNGSGSTSHNKRRSSKSSNRSVDQSIIQLIGKAVNDKSGKLNVEISLPQPSEEKQNGPIEKGMYRLRILVHNSKDAAKSEFEYFVDGISID